MPTLLIDPNPAVFGTLRTTTRDGALELHWNQSNDLIANAAMVPTGILMIAGSVALMRLSRGSPDNTVFMIGLLGTLIGIMICVVASAHLLAWRLHGRSKIGRLLASCDGECFRVFGLDGREVFALPAGHGTEILLLDCFMFAHSDEHRHRNSRDTTAIIQIQIGQNSESGMQYHPLVTILKVGLCPILRRHAYKFARDCGVACRTCSLGLDDLPSYREWESGCESASKINR